MTPYRAPRTNLDRQSHLPVLLMAVGLFTVVNNFYKLRRPGLVNALLVIVTLGLLAFLSVDLITNMQTTGAVISRWDYVVQDGLVKLYIKPVSLRNFQGQKLIAVLRVKDSRKDADDETRFAISALHSVPDVSEGLPEIALASAPIQDLIKPDSGFELRLFVVPRTFTGTDLIRLGDVVEKRGGKLVDKVGFSADRDLTKWQTIQELYQNLSPSERANFDAHRP